MHCMDLYVFVVAALCAKIYAIHVGADYVRPMRIIIFGLYTWDFISDVIFAARALQQKYFVQGGLSVAFVIIPWIVNIVLLIKSQNRWIQDSAIKYAVSSWLLKYDKKLIFLTMFCGSAFAAIELCNSRAFGV